MPRGKVTVLILGLLAAPRIAGAAGEYIGAERCGSCHPAEYEAWRDTGHARALARLTRVQQEDPVCRSCHTMSPQSDDPALRGVQCESCHGAGSLYAPEYVMRDGKLAELFGLEAVKAQTCAPCHSGQTPNVRPFDYETLVKLVNHGAADEAAKEKGGGDS